MFETMFKEGFKAANISIMNSSCERSIHTVITAIFRTSHTWTQSMSENMCLQSLQFIWRPGLR